MEYSQSIKIKIKSFAKQDVIKLYSDLYEIIHPLNTKPINLLINLSLTNGSSYRFTTLDDFKNEIQTSDKFQNLSMSIYCGEGHITNAISVFNSFGEWDISFRSSDKAWVDEEAFKYQQQIKTDEISNSSVKKEPWKREHTIAILGIFITVILAIIGYSISH